MATATAARSLANGDDDVTKMMCEERAGDITELTESERDFRLKTADNLQECDEEEQRRLDELLTQCHDYIYSQGHVTSSKIITNGSLTSRTPQLSPRHDVTSGVMAACWLELPVSSSRDAFPFPNNDVIDVTSHIYCHDDVSAATVTFSCNY